MINLTDQHDLVHKVDKNARTVISCELSRWPVEVHDLVISKDSALELMTIY